MWVPGSGDVYFTVCVPGSGDVYCGVYLVVVLCTVLCAYLVVVMCTVLCVYLVVVLCTLPTVKPILLSLFLTPDWMALRSQGVLPCLYLPDFSLASVRILLSLLRHGEAQAQDQQLEEFRDLVCILGVKLVILWRLTYVS